VSKTCEKEEKKGPVEIALAQVDLCVTALESCKGKLSAEDYKALRVRLGHLMDTLYSVGRELSKST